MHDCTLPNPWLLEQTPVIFLTFVLQQHSEMPLPFTRHARTRMKYITTHCVAGRPTLHRATAVPIHKDIKQTIAERWKPLYLAQHCYTCNIPWLNALAPCQRWVQPQPEPQAELCTTCSNKSNAATQQSNRSYKYRNQLPSLHFPSDWTLHPC